METISMKFQNTNSHFITENKFRILFFILLFILSSIKIFGQTTPATATIQNEQQIAFIVNQTQTSIVTTSTQIDFVNWFMGSRQMQHNEYESVSQFKPTSTKKQILFSGVTPNKVLYRTFMKRVISKDNATV